ncbi:MAG TPA: hypothetical protein VGZ32_11510 [Actinocrinis sp.]|uniref:hypothetical protein n=1 Tax=Actinocrinis sp. TaxID=1920516 RepID=UPI002DDDAD4C|nr:hypothetical protein [Actinocrinis sp.]HEV3170962.1 hypothetical protein [Actinocrinis sp.]
MSGHEEKDPFGETQSPEDPLGLFEAFRARREEDQAPVESFPSPEPYSSEPTAELPPVETEATVQFNPAQFNPAQFNAGQYSAGQYGAAPYGSAEGAYGPGFASEAAYGAGFASPPPQSDFDDYSSAAPAGPARWRGKTRSAVVFGAVAVLAAGLGVGVYAATQSSGGKPGASPAVTTSVSPANPSAGSSKGAKTGKVLTARLTVTAVGTDSFTGKTANGTALTVRIATGTKFGTAARPFTRAQLVPGAVVYVRLRHAANGAAIATEIAAGDARKPATSATATPSAGA